MTLVLRDLCFSKSQEILCLPIGHMQRRQASRPIFASGGGAVDFLSALNMSLIGSGSVMNVPDLGPRIAWRTRQSINFENSEPRRAKLGRLCDCSWA